jgi:predicted DNA-binding transcriptional regulator YafY
MHRLDRALAILLILRSGQTISAQALARRFEVTTRTVYRDMELLASAGVPVYAEMGRAGGFRLIEGYFVPPVMFTEGEVTSLLTGLALLGRLRATPFASERESAGHKLAAVLPERLRARLAQLSQAIGFEALPPDLLHPERDRLLPHEGDPGGAGHESEVLGAVLGAVLGRHAVDLRYCSAERAEAELSGVIPRGLLWDRDRWYIVGSMPGRPGAIRLWRADRVEALTARAGAVEAPALAIGPLLGRAWLRDAMAHWAAESPVTLRLTAEQAAQLRRDWYFAHAAFSAHPGGGELVTFGEDDSRVVFALLRWLGPGAELIAPEAWREQIAGQLRVMLASYTDGSGSPSTT